MIDRLLPGPVKQGRQLTDNKTIFKRSKYVSKMWKISLIDLSLTQSPPEINDSLTGLCHACAGCRNRIDF